MNKPLCRCLALAAALSVHVQLVPAFAQNQDRPWMNVRLSPDERAEMVLKQMTLDEKIDLVHGQGMPGWG